MGVSVAVLLALFLSVMVFLCLSFIVCLSLSVFHSLSFFCVIFFCHFFSLSFSFFRRFIEPNRNMIFVPFDVLRHVQSGRHYVFCPGTVQGLSGSGVAFLSRISLPVSVARQLMLAGGFCYWDVVLFGTDEYACLVF
jgi:hypothetical protein